MLLEEGVCYDQCIFLAKLYEPLPCFILYSKAKFACYPGVSWLPTITFQSPIMKRTFLGMLVLKGFVGLHRTIQLQILQHYQSGQGTFHAKMGSITDRNDMDLTEAEGIKNR